MKNEIGYIRVINALRGQNLTALLEGSEENFEPDGEDVVLELVVANELTKEILHEYGYFNNVQELKEFADTHGIVLEEVE